ncbi:MAG: helical backbone metal receptor [Mucilaginibacter sp.]
MPLFYDQLKRPVNVPSPPKRIISVVPSQTELLFYLGLDAEIIGITKFCIHPEHQFNTKTKIGGTKQLNINLIKSLQPDLIIANKEENEQSQIEELAKHFPVWISDINDLPGALDMIMKIAQVVTLEQEAEELITAIKEQFEVLHINLSPLKAAYLIWRKPYMAAGKDTFIDSMLQNCGLTNVLTAQRYPELTADELAAANPGIVLLSSEPYPFTNKHIDELQAILPAAKIIVVDGEIFSWYGSRLLQAPAYFGQLMERLA